MEFGCDRRTRGIFRTSDPTDQDRLGRVDHNDSHRRGCLRRMGDPWTCRSRRARFRWRRGRRVPQFAIFAPADDRLKGYLARSATAGVRHRTSSCIAVKLVAGQRSAGRACSRRSHELKNPRLASPDQRTPSARISSRFRVRHDLRQGARRGGSGEMRRAAIPKFCGKSWCKGLVEMREARCRGTAFRSSPVGV